MIRMTLTMLFLSLFFSCDPDGKKKCNWTLEPEPRMKDKASEGMIPVCARNRESMKEDCRLQTTMEHAKSSLNKKFKYVDLKVKTYGLPRTIDKIEFCD